MRTGTVLLCFGALLAGAVGLWSCVGHETSRPNVLLITVDTLRSDRLSCYGSTSARTPNVDRLAEQGVLFENATAPIPLTKPSHFSLFSSLYPREHGVLNNQLNLPDDVPLFSELFTRGGYRTGAFISAKLLSMASGAGRGFEHFDVPEGHAREAAEVVPLAQDWLRGVDPSTPFLAWVHLYDPHMPYAPPEEDRPAKEPAIAEFLPIANWKRLGEVADAHGGDVPREAYDWALSLYDGEVQSMDRWIGALLNTLHELGRADDTIVVFTADHGECFENGHFFSHRNCIYEPAAAVPLIVRFPSVISEPIRRDDVVELLDIAPTLLTLCGMEVPETFRGRDLLGPPRDTTRQRAFVQHPFEHAGATAAVLQKRSAIRTVLGQPVDKGPGAVEQVAIRTPRWKLILSGDRTELFDLVADPGELTDLSAEHPATVSELQAEIQGWSTEHPLRVLHEGMVDEEMLETLRALGYVQ